MKQSPKVKIVRAKEEKTDPLDPGCSHIDVKDGKRVRCGVKPATFWARCMCRCDCSERICEYHMTLGVWCKCLCLHPPPSGTYGPFDDISPWQENAIRILEGD